LLIIFYLQKLFRSAAGTIPAVCERAAKVRNIFIKRQQLLHDLKRGALINALCILLKFHKINKT